MTEGLVVEILIWRRWSTTLAKEVGADLGVRPDWGRSQRCQLCQAGRSQQEVVSTFSYKIHCEVVSTFSDNAKGYVHISGKKSTKGFVLFFWKIVVTLYWLCQPLQWDGDNVKFCTTNSWLTIGGEIFQRQCIKTSSESNSGRNPDLVNIGCVSTSSVHV